MKKLSVVLVGLMVSGTLMASPTLETPGGELSTMLEETKHCRVDTSQFNVNDVLYTNGLMNYSLTLVGENEKLTQKQVDMLKRACYNEVIETKKGDVTCVRH